LEIDPAVRHEISLLEILWIRVSVSTLSDLNQEVYKEVEE
jgi:hypothetical protein